MEDHEYKYIHKRPQFVSTLNSGKSCSIDLKPKVVEKSIFVHSLQQTPTRIKKKTKSKTRHGVRISRYDFPFRKGRKLQYTQDFFESVAIATKEELIYTMKDDQDEHLRGKNYQEELIIVS